MALGPLVATIPDAIVGTAYTYQVQQSDIIFVFTAFYGPSANLPPYDMVILGAPFGSLMLADNFTGLAIPGMDITVGGLVFGTPTVAGNYVPVIRPQSQPNPSPPPTNFAQDTLIVNQWRIRNPGNRSYPIF